MLRTPVLNHLLAVLQTPAFCIHQSPECVGLGVGVMTQGGSLLKLCPDKMIENSGAPICINICISLAIR